MMDSHTLEENSTSENSLQDSQMFGSLNINDTCISAEPTPFPLKNGNNFSQTYKVWLEFYPYIYSTSLLFHYLRE